MKIITFKLSTTDKNYKIGKLISDSEIVDLTSLTGKENLTAYELLDCFDLENDFLAKAKSADDLPKISRANVTVCATVPRPGKIICIGLNYRDHAEESGMAIPKSPIIFSKFGTCVIAPNDSILVPIESQQTDYEAEFSVVIGKTAKYVSRENAMDYVLGYTNFNDVSARDFQFADGQWVRGKSCDSFAPMGEFIATTDEIENPHNLRIQFRLNGETMQDSNTNQLIFKIPKLIEFLTKSHTLEPGDIIATGTPPGVGFARKPPIFLKDGDVCEVEIEGLGVLKNTVKAS
jgi:2-keto-4-pentenoate hydratase/2-oxohepta-3-ene-1,7-dioic acid hydratase in catechol pathway